MGTRPLRFKDFAHHLQLIQDRRARRDKAKILSRFLEQLDTFELPAAIYLCQGRLAETYRQRQTAHIRLSHRQVASLLKERPCHPSATSLSILDDAHLNLPTDGILDSLPALYNALHTSIPLLDAWLSRQQPMPAWLAELSRQMTEQEMECLSRILTGPLLKDEVIISALAHHVPSAVGVKEALQKAYKYTVPDLGAVATMILKEPEQKRYWALVEMSPQPGIPLKPQEIARWDSVEDAWRAMGRCYVQPKHDGLQIQIHKQGNGVCLFDRKLEGRTSQFPEVAEACRTQIPADTAILDSEIVGFDPASGRILPWKEILSASTHRVFVFDIILLDGQDWRGRVYHERRRRLCQLLWDHGAEAQVLSVVHEEFVETQRDLQDLYQRWSTRGDTEGVIIIKPGGHYLSGRITKEKAKLKPYLSLDVVVLGYRVSEKGIPSFLLGVWHEMKSELIPVGWAEGAIIPPDTRQELWKRCQALRVTRKPTVVANDLAPRVWVRPQVVAEVTVKGRTRDSKYRLAGYRLYRKKDFRMRDDLEIEDVDNLQEFLSFPLPPGEGDPEWQTTSDWKHRIQGSTTSGEREIHQSFSAYRAAPYTRDAVHDSSRFVETPPANQERQKLLADSRTRSISPHNDELRQLALFPGSAELDKSSDQEQKQPADIQERSTSAHDNEWKQLAFLPMSDLLDRSNDQG